MMTFDTDCKQVAYKYYHVGVTASVEVYTVLSRVRVKIIEDYRVGMGSDLEDILSCGVCIITKMQKETVQMRPNEDELLVLQ